LWIVSREEQRAERAIAEAAFAATSKTRYWDCATGITEIREDGRTAVLAQVNDPAAAIQWIGASRDRAVYVLRDLDQWLRDPSLMRAIKSLARTLKAVPKSEARALIVLSPAADVPAALGDCVVVEWPLPDRAEVAAILDATMAVYAGDDRVTQLVNGARDAAIDASIGLSASEIEATYARSLVTRLTVDASIVHAEKKRIVAKAGGLTWTDPDPRGLDAVGGLDNLKAWIKSRRAAFTTRARAYGLPQPKGCLLVGLPGCGKSLTAKAIAIGFGGLPLLRLDLGGLQSKYVGESQQAIRKALALAEAVSPCVLWIDEIEKGLAGSTGAQGDGGVSADQLGTFLSWMQDRTGSVFVLATANDVSALPPELLRKGRFDELWSVDLPTTSERGEIILATLKAHRIAADTVAAIDAATLARVTAGFSGAEVASIVPSAMFAAFDDGERQITTADLTAAAAAVVPMAKTSAEKIEALRTWAKGRARPASEPETGAGPMAARDLDL
jgi:hypothetical protein